LLIKLAYIRSHQMTVVCPKLSRKPDVKLSDIIMDLKISQLWNMTPCSLVDFIFRERSVNFYQTARGHTPEDSSYLWLLRPFASQICRRRCRFFRRPVNMYVHGVVCFASLCCKIIDPIVGSGLRQEIQSLV
jgi:hypothetical protein